MRRVPHPHLFCLDCLDDLDILEGLDNLEGITSPRSFHCHEASYPWSHRY
jgi:hypothetical protein